MEVVGKGEEGENQEEEGEEGGVGWGLKCRPGGTLPYLVMQH